MTELLLKLCGVRLDDAQRVSEIEWALRHTAWLGWICATAVVLLGLAWFSYRGTRGMLTPWQRHTLTALRMLLLLLLLLLLMRPVLVFTVETAIRRTLLTMVDASGSMKIQDPRFDPVDLKRAAIARGLLDPRKGLEQALDPTLTASLKLIPRIDVLRGMWKNEVLAIFPTLQRELDVITYRFGQTLDEAPDATGAWLDRMEPSATATALGDTLRDLLQRKRGQAIAGVLIATDGANNFGSAPLEAARMARQEGVPLYFYGVGITSPRDLIVNALLTQQTAFVKDELPVTIRVRGQGLKGETAKLTLRLVPNSGGEGTVVAEKELTFTGDEDLAVPMPFTPQSIGEYELQASFAIRDDEASRENNVASQRIRIIDSKVKVLVIETAPRWEFRYLQNTLLRDRRLEARFVLLEADPGVTAGENSPFLAKVPATREECFKFDLIILGDIAPDTLNADQQKILEDFVQKFGGSVLFIAGPRANPHRYAGTALERLLPVELDPSPASLQPASGTTVELTPQGRAHPLLRIASTEEESAAAWRKFGRLYWTANVLRAKPSAQVLLVDADATRGNRHGKAVIAAFQPYGLGQVFYLGTDNTWRWRRNEGERSHTILWGQLTQKLGLHHLLGGSKRTQLSADRQSYTTGERVGIFARLHGADFAPLREATVEAGFTVRVGGTPGPEQAVTLRAVPEQPGMYRGEFIAVSPGIHQFAVKSDPATVLDIVVAEPRFESGETAMNETLLRQMAETSGGAYFREENLWQLPAAIAAKTERIESRVDGELWASPLCFLLLLLLAALEWWLRKRWQLK